MNAKLRYSPPSLNDITLKEWERWERAERCYRTHPAFYRLRLFLLFAEGLIAAALILSVVALIVVNCVLNPMKNLWLIGLIIFSLLIIGYTCYVCITQRPLKGLPELSEKDWPRLHELVRNTAKSVGAPRIHHVFLHPLVFNAEVSVSFAHVPRLRRNMLTIGFPLLAALSERGLRGVLAHELEHVAQNDAAHGSALSCFRAVLASCTLGPSKFPIDRWRQSYLRRVDRLMTPLARERELAADRTVSRLFGKDTLWEMLVAVELRSQDADITEMIRKLAQSGSDNPPSFAAAVRASMRRTIPEAEARWRIGKALRSTIPPIEAHPSLSVRAGTTSLNDLLPFASTPQNAIESVFGSAEALDSAMDATVGEAFAQEKESMRKVIGKREARLAMLPTKNASPDETLERASILVELDRKDEALAALRAGRAEHPDNVALEAAELERLLSDAASAEEGAPIADRLEQLIEKDPIVRVWSEDALMTHYLETGATDRIKHLLELRQRTDNALNGRLYAELRPSDNIRPIETDDECIDSLTKALAGRSVREVYAVLRVYEGTGTFTSFIVICWRFLADSINLLSEFNDEFEGKYVFVSGSRALFRRLAELGVKPIPIPRKAPRQE